MSANVTKTGLSSSSDFINHWNYWNFQDFNHTVVFMTCLFLWKYFYTERVRARERNSLSCHAKFDNSWIMNKDIKGVSCHSNKSLVSVIKQYGVAFSFLMRKYVIPIVCQNRMVKNRELATTWKDDPTPPTHSPHFLFSPDSIPPT